MLTSSPSSLVDAGSMRKTSMSHMLYKYYSLVSAASREKRDLERGI